MVSLTSGIPQTDANPLLDWFDQSDEIEAGRRAAMDQWRRESTRRIDAALLDPETFFADKPLPYPEQAVAMLGGADAIRRSTVVSSYLSLATDGRPVPTDPVAREALRDQIAAQRFAGRGAGSDQSFHAEILAEATGRKDRKDLVTRLAATASAQALIDTAGAAAATGFPMFLAEARKAPGYKPGHDFALLETWNAEQARTRAELEEFGEALPAAWRSITGNATGQDSRTAFDAWQQMDGPARGRFLDTLGRLGKSLTPDQRRGFWENFVVQGSRDITRIAGAGARAAWDAPDTFRNNSLSGSFDTPEEALARREEAAETSRFQSDWRSLEAGLARVLAEDYDPVVGNWGDDGSTLRAVESGLYSIPGVAATVAPALLPGGQLASLAILEDEAWNNVNSTLLSAGLDPAAAAARADELSGMVAAVNYLPERFGLNVIARRIPGLTAVTDKIQSQLGRGILHAATAQTAEFTTETFQNYSHAAILDALALADSEIPGGNLSRETESFWTDSVTTFASILPLAIMGVPGAVSRENHARAVAETDTRVRAAYGYTEADNAAIDAAEGPAALAEAVERAEANRDPRSEAAKDATQELAEEIEAARAAETAASRAAMDAGIVPRAVRGADGVWTLYDTGSGQEIGKAPNWQGASRLAIAHANLAGDRDADRIATLITTYQAAEASGEWSQQTGRTTETQLDLGREMTAAEFAGESQAARDRAAAQERLAGGDGSLTSQVFGQSRTEFAEGQLRTVNRILGGGSVLDVFHEEAHGFRRAARAAGSITREDDIAILRAVDTVLSGTTREGTRLAILPENFDTLSMEDQDVAIDEGISQLMESEVLRSRKGGGQRPIPAGIVSKNLSALARILGDQRLGKFRSFITAIREFFGLAIDRAAAIQRGLAEGTLDRQSYDSYLAKLYGIDEQLAYEQMARDAEAEILEGAEMVPAGDGDPFSLGRTVVTPADGSRVFPGAEGTPTVIGPAAFSIRAFHGTPHKVDKFTTDRIGTGEGAQAFGWGLYFAESKAVADDYANRLGAFYMSADGEDFNFLNPRHVAGLIVAKPAHAGLSPEDLANAMEWEPKGILPSGSESITEKVIDALRSGDIAEYRQTQGNLYTVTLKVEDDQLLDWDKPLSEQTEQVRAALRVAYEQQGLDYPENAATPKTGESLYRDMVAAAGGLISLDASAASAFLLEHGIRGIRFLDGNSRQQGEGSSNYVIFDEADIEILEENGQPVSFSLGSARLGVLTGDSIRRIKDPLRRAQAMERVSRKLEDLRLEAERLELLAGSRRIRKSLAKEAAMRQAMRREELENEAWARHAAVLSDDDLTKLRAQPGHAFLADPTSHLKGRLLSRTAAAKKYPDLFAANPNPAEYDGSENVSRTVFGGTLAPDLAAQEMFEAGLIREPSPDAMWQLLESEAKHVAGMKRILEAAKADLREARTVAKAETNAWLAEQTKGQQELTVEVTRQSILERLAALDAILSSVPPEVRGRVGGYMQAARITSSDAGLEFLRERLAKVDDAMETWLKRQYDIEFRALLDRARPERDEAGKKPRGKIGSDVHQLFDSIRDAMTLSADEVEALAVSLETLAQGEDTTAAQASHLTLEANLVRLAGNWSKADAARREAALLEATRIYEAGYGQHRTEMLRKRERRAFARDRLQQATGKTGTRRELQTREEKDKGTKTGRLRSIGDNFRSFEQILQQAFGLASEDGTFLADWERRADAAKTDAIHHKQDLIEQLFTDLAGSRFKGEQLHEKLSRKAAIEVAGEKFSELEAVTATLMWRQEDGQRHMRGHVDDQGKPAGDWHYEETFMAELESKLSPEAKAIRLHLIEQYAAEYDRLNPVFRQLNGVNLPRTKNYSPLTVAPANVAAGQVQDPVSAFGLTAVSLTPGSLRKRSETAVAQPLFRDALEVYLAHAKQMEHWMAYAPFATEAMAILNTRELGNAIEAAAGREALTTLRSWLDYFAQGGIRDASAHIGFNRLWNRIASRFAQMALVGRVSVLAIQSTQLGAALSQMPTGAYLSRFARLMSGRLGWGAALKSEYIQRRLKQQPAIVQQAMEGLRAGKPTRLKFLVRQIGRTIAGADALFTAGTFAMVHDYQLAQAKARGMSGPEAEAWALQEAERATDRIAQPVRPGARSMVELTGTNPAMRILWSFSSDARQKLALSLLGHSKRSMPEKIRAYAVTWLVGGVVATLIRTAMRDIRDDGEDDEIFDERNWDLGRMTLSATLGPLQGVALIGEAIEAAIFAAMGEYLPSGTMLDTTANAAKAARNVDKWFSGDRELEDALKDAEAMLMGAGMIHESPAAATSLMHIVRDLLAFIDNATGD